MLEVRQVSKKFGSTRALEGVDILFEPGEIHAVLGENGAGKSTLMHVLSGFVRPDEGYVTLYGEELALGRPFACRRMGVGMIHQHFTLVPEFTVRENLLLARLDHLVSVLQEYKAVEAALQLARELNWQFDLDAKVSQLPVGVQQRVEIIKTLSSSTKVALFDEPTAVLGPDEVDDLFRVLRSLRDQGRIVVLIAHKLSEIMQIADRVTVLRQGKVVGRAASKDVSQRTLATWMVGDLPESFSRPPLTQGTESLQISRLRVKGDRGEDAVRGIDLRVRRGEIVGIAGVDGNGQVELAEAVAGIRAVNSGTVSFAQAQELSVGYIPQDRQSDGLALTMSVGENFLITCHNRRDLSRGMFLNWVAISSWAKGLMRRFDVAAKSPRSQVASLSGGNQQKVVVARTLDRMPEFLVAVNPTRGLDVRATHFVHGQILKARSEGAAILLVSTDMEEIAALSDRTFFISAGKLLQGGAAAFLGGTAE